MEMSFLIHLPKHLHDQKYCKVMFQYTVIYLVNLCFVCLKIREREREREREKQQLSQLMRLWYLSHRRPAKAQASLRSLARAFAVRIHEAIRLMTKPTK